MKQKMIFCLIFSLFLLSFTAKAQEEQKATDIYQVETRDGNIFRGKLLHENENEVVLETGTLGEITIKRADIKRMETLDKVKQVGTDYWTEHPQDVRYLWTSTGYGLRKGTGYYQNVWIFFNQFAYGVTDNFSVGLGLVPLFLFEGTSSPFWLTPKLSVPVVEDKFSLGVGALLGTVVGEDHTGFGMFYGVATIGSRQKNLSFGAGWAYAVGEISERPVFNISGMIRTGRKGYLLTENYFFDADEGFGAMLSLAGRSIIGHKVGIDYGGMIPVGEDIGLNVIPWLGLTVPF
ncbi:hypothetical protein [Gaoshiqia sp. Z1-71]|uniref:hypothetical protein n=1 Tax=Gaoshiqia hydrogeniformans TaxID=3290090 RepID=UPI003BF8F22F